MSARGNKPKVRKYESIIVEIFKKHYKKGITEFEFDRDELNKAANKHKIKNLGDLIYSFRYRKTFPQVISRTAPRGSEWIIEGAGRGKYRFKLARVSRIIPRSDLLRIKIPDSTPEIVVKYAQNDEQALLAKVRYNRLIDIFLSITTHSLQNHLRTTVTNIGQIEIDELYVGLNKNGIQFVIPVQAKGKSDQLGVVQTKQDFLCCMQKFPHLLCRPVAAQFLDCGGIALFELTLEDGQVKIVLEKHYQLVSSEEITSNDLKTYRNIGD